MAILLPYNEAWRTIAHKGVNMELGNMMISVDRGI